MAKTFIILQYKYKQLDKVETEKKQKDGNE